MGYALFTARKLMLQNRLNQMNYRLMILSQQRNDLVQQAADLEMQNGYKKTLRSIFASQDYQKGVQDLLDNPPSDSNTQKLKLESLQADMQSATGKDALQELLDKSKINNIHAVENQIDLEMKKLETQVKETTAEMESVEKAEEQGIKASAPKYGGGAG